MSAVCSNCGAPEEAGRILCAYCRVAYSQEALSSAILCPSCRTPNPPNCQQCVSCSAWLVVQCVFCGALSPYSNPQCHSCGEAFAGSQQRLQTRQQAEERQHNMQIASTVGTVAAGFLGAFAGVAVEELLDDD